MIDAIGEAVRAERRRRVRLLILIGLLLLFVTRAGLDYWAGGRVKIELARLEQRYGSLDESTLRVASVPAADNRARVVRAAAALTVPRLERDSAFGGVRGSQQSADPSPVPPDLRSFVLANRPAIRLADDVRVRRQSSWDVAYKHEGDLPPWKDIRTLSYALYLAARLDLEGGRPDEAARALSTGLAVPASLRQEPVVIVQLMRIALVDEHLEGTLRLLAEAEPSRASLEDLARWLAENRSSDSMQTAAIGELKLYHDLWTRAASNRFDPPTSGPRFLLGPLVWLERPLIRLAHTRYLQRMGRLLETRPGAHELPESSRPWLVGIPFEMADTSALEHAMDTGDLLETRLGIAETAVALRRFRIDHGSYPDALSALEPAYLTALPVDVFTGQPPVYSREGAGFTLRGGSGTSVPSAKDSRFEWRVSR